MFTSEQYRNWTDTSQEILISRLNDISFGRCARKQESIVHFVSRLMRQADFCGFGGTRDTQVRHQLIDGCLSTKLRLKLLEKGNDLTLDVALRMSSSHESVTQQANEMQLDNVHKIDIKRSSRVKTGDKPRGPCLLYTSPSPRDQRGSRMPSSA